MAVREVHLFGDPVSLPKAETITDFDTTLSHLIGGMSDTVDEQQGVGLTTSQVGALRRVFVYDCNDTRGHIINPEWETAGDGAIHEVEGCLSIPGINGPVARHARIHVTSQDRHGTPVSFETDDLLARYIQHESDHLDGALFLRRLEGDERRTAMRSLRGQD